MSNKSQQVHITGIALPKNPSGVLKHVNDVERSDHTNLGNVSYSENQISGVVGDMNGYSKVHVYGSTSSSNHLHLLVSGDNANYYRHNEIFPTEHNGTFHFSQTFENLSRYFTFHNGAVAQNITFNYTLIK
jgi:hypothetical protein